MEIPVVRWSGRPIDEEEIVKFEEEWRVIFDKVQTKCTIGVTANGDKQLDVMRMQKLLSRLEKSLQQKYPTEQKWDRITKDEEWIEKIDRYGVIMCGKHAVTGGLVYVIFDEEVYQR